MPTINNQANLAYQYNSSSSQTSSNIVETTVLDPYSITASKKALTSTYRDDSTITYVTTVKNNGSGNLYNITLTDDLGNNALDLVGTSLYLYRNNQLTPLIASSYNPLTIELDGLFEVGEEILIIYNALINDKDVQSITNTQSISANSGTSTGTIIQVTPDPSATITKEQYASLNIIKSASQQSIMSGDDLTYSFTISNTGNIIAENVVLTDVLPSSFTINSITLDNNGTIVNYDPSQYDLNTTTNLLTLPNASGTPISINPNTQALLTINGTVNL